MSNPGVYLGYFIADISVSNRNVIKGQSLFQFKLYQTGLRIKQISNRLRFLGGVRLGTESGA